MALSDLIRSKTFVILALEKAKASGDHTAVRRLGMRAAEMEASIAAALIAAGRVEDALVNLISQASCLQDVGLFAEASAVLGTVIRKATDDVTRLWAQREQRRLAGTTRSQLDDAITARSAEAQHSRVSLSAVPAFIIEKVVRVIVFHHDHCFDGAASAAVATSFLERLFYPKGEFEYKGLSHDPSYHPVLDGDVNVIVDFKYSSDSRLTWWFDHHQSAFSSPGDGEHFRRDTSGRRFSDPSFKSCARLIATVAKREFGFDAPELDDLVQWADVIDGAQYADANAAVTLEAPALKLTLVIEGAESPGIIPKIIRWMRYRSLTQIIEEPSIQEVFVPLYERHRRSIDILKRKSRQDGTVVFCDLIGSGVEGYNKFIPYHLFPESHYSVSVNVSKYRTKVSVGANPWAPVGLKHNLGAICERYGGGGYPMVGSVSFEIGAVSEARVVARQIVEELTR